MLHRTKNNEYELKKPIAEGSYGEIYEAINHSQNEKMLAAKIMKNIFRNPNHAQRIFREIIILKLLKGHPNIISLEDIGLLPESEETHDSIILYFEKMDSDLYKITHTEQIFTMIHIQYFLYNLLCGTHYLHSAGIVHRDLKPANILLNADCTLKICDFNLSRDLNIQPDTTEQGSQSKISGPLPLFRQLTRHVVTRWYRAPEIILGGKGSYNFSVDMWSIGCIFAELLMMQTSLENRAPLFAGDACYPFSGGINSQHDQLKEIFNLLGTPNETDLDSLQLDEKELEYVKSFDYQEPKDLAAHFPYIQNEQAIDFLKKCLVIDPTKRITVEQALEHPIVATRRNSKENLRFLISSLSAEEKTSMTEYHEFEMKLEAQKLAKESFKTEDIRKLIFKEIETFDPSPKNRISTETCVKPSVYEEKDAPHTTSTNKPPSVPKSHHQTTYRFFSHSTPPADGFKDKPERQTCCSIS